MLELFPHGFEEVEHADGVELVAYTDAGGEERLWQAFGGASASDVESGWEERWKEFHRPVRVGGLWIGPPWERAPADAIGIVIDPGRAFGTGAHATTRLCLELLQGLEPGSIVDVGCGSGVLSIAAAKLGFDPVIGVDVDPQAIEATTANAHANAVSVSARLVDALEEEIPRADVTVANVTRETVVTLAPLLRSRLFVTSGYLASDSVELDGFHHLERAVAEGWAADLHERP